MERRYQVFVSSTYRDLLDERREVIQALLELDCIPSGMEMFPAASESQWSLIKRAIDDCDYYLVIVAGRYGSLDVDGLSYTEKEFDYAVSQDKPVIGFVHENPDLLPSGMVEFDENARRRLIDFRGKVMERLVKSFNSPDSLGAVVSRSLIKLIKQQPTEGWVRGRFAVAQEVNEELATLRARVAQFELNGAKEQAGLIAATKDLAQGSDAFDVTVATRNETKPFECAVAVTWNDVIKAIGGLLLEGDAEGETCRRVLADSLKQLYKEHVMERISVDDPWGGHGRRRFSQLPSRLYDDLSVSTESWRVISHQLQALRLVEVFSLSESSALPTDYTRTSYVSNTFLTTYWRLGAYGREVVLGMVALRRDAVGAGTESALAD